MQLKTALDGWWNIYEGNLNNLQNIRLSRFVGMWGSPSLSERLPKYWILSYFGGWGVWGWGWCVKTWWERFPASLKRKKKGSVKALAVWQVCIYSSSDLCNYNTKPPAPTCLLQGCHIQAKSVPGWKENPPFGISGLLGSAAQCALRK